jgi:hypothetical protein
MDLRMFFKNRLEIKNQPQDIGTMPATNTSGSLCGRKRLCSDNECQECFKRSFASNPKSKFLCDGEPCPRTLFRSGSKKCRFVCDAGHPFEMTINNVSNGKWCKKCGHISSSDKQRKSHDDFVRRATELHSGKYIYPDPYRGDAIKITILCPTHGAFQQSPGSHLAGSGCSQCGFKLRAEKKTLSQEDCLSRFRDQHGNRYGYGKVDYKGQAIPVIIVCPVHGDFEQLPHVHWAGMGCRKCGIQETADSQRLTTEEFVRRAQEVHGDADDYSPTKYMRGHDKVTIACRVHGLYEQNAYNHLAGFRCRRCTPMGYSKLAIEWLNFMSLYSGVVIRHACNGGEVTLPGTLYRPDGYSDGCVWEFDGDYYHGNPKYYAGDRPFPHSKTGTTFGDNLVRTVRKRVVMRSLGFKVIHIWGSEWERAKDLVVQIQRAFRSRVRT